MPPFPESPRYLSPFQGNLFSLHSLDFQAEDRLTPRWHMGQPCVKASWESLEGIPQLLFSTRREALHCCYSSGRKCTCISHSRGGLTPLGRLQNTQRSMSALERNPQVLAPTPHKVLGPGIEGEESREAPE